MYQKSNMEILVSKMDMVDDKEGEKVDFEAGEKKNGSSAGTDLAP